MTENNHSYAIVSTTRFLLLVDLSSKLVKPLEWGREEYYGISWFPEDTELVLSHSVVDNASLVDISSYAQSEVGLISHGKVSVPGFLSQPHQIVCGTDGRVICTNTGRNAICAINLRQPGHFHEARISTTRWDRLSIENIHGDHLNSVFQKGDRLYVMAHGHNKGSILATFDYPDMQLIGMESIKGRFGMHNIWVTNDDQRISCHSEVGAVVDLNSNEILFEAGVGAYTRGLAGSTEFVLVGESQIRGRASRQSSMSAVWLLDRKTWQPLDYFCLGPYGSVHEVRLANVADEAHHGHVFKGLSALVERDRSQEFAEMRIAESIMAKVTRGAWRPFRSIFGTPSDGLAHAKKASADELCLQVLAPLALHERIKFRYSLDDPANQSHVGIVAYRGNGNDTDMDAIILWRSSETQAQLSFWRHDGEVWAARGGVSIAGLRLNGEMQFYVTPEGVSLRIDGDIVLDTPLEGFSPKSVLGIRWLGATIYPPEIFSPPSELSGHF